MPGRLLNSTDRKEDKEKRKSTFWQEVSGRVANHARAEEHRTQNRRRWGRGC